MELCRIAMLVFHIDAIVGGNLSRTFKAYMWWQMASIYIYLWFQTEQDTFHFLCSLDNETVKMFFEVAHQRVENDCRLHSNNCMIFHSHSLFYVEVRHFMHVFLSLSSTVTVGNMIKYFAAVAQRKGRSKTRRDQRIKLEHVNFLLNLWNVETAFYTYDFFFISWSRCLLVYMYYIAKISNKLESFCLTSWCCDQLFPCVCICIINSLIH